MFSCLSALRLRASTAASEELLSKVEGVSTTDDKSAEIIESDLTAFSERFVSLSFSNLDTKFEIIVRMKRTTLSFIGVFFCLALQI